MNTPTMFSILAAGVLIAIQAFAQASPPVAPDNTRANKTEPSNAAATADQQSNNPADIEVTKRIRQSVVGDKSLSTDAHNVKIVSMGGKITLNGVVRSQAEKDAVEMKAHQVAGKSQVTNDLKIEPGQSSP